MKKQILFTFVVLFIVVLAFFGYRNLNKKEKVNPIDNVMSSYKNYKFHNIEKNDLFKLKDLVIKYDMTKESSVIKYNDKSISAYLIDDYLHLMVNDIDYKYPDIGEVDRLMFYKYCSCNEECYRLVILTEEGNIYYLEFSDDINFEDPNIFKKIESDYIYKNIGYVNDLNVNSKCGVNGLVLVDDADNTHIYDNKLNIYEQTYSTFLKNNDHILYIYPDGIINLDSFDKINNRFSEIYTIDNAFYLVSVDSKIYKLTLDNNLSLVSNKTISKIGIYNKNTIIIIFNDATAKKINVNSVFR